MIHHKVKIVTLRGVGGSALTIEALAEKIESACDEVTSSGELGWGLVTTLAIDPRSSMGTTDPPALLLIFAEGR